MPSWLRRGKMLDTEATKERVSRAISCCSVACNQFLAFGMRKELDDFTLNSFYHNFCGKSIIFLVVCFVLANQISNKIGRRRYLQALLKFELYATQS